jgi:hypothetical protein
MLANLKILTYFSDSFTYKNIVFSHAANYAEKLLSLYNLYNKDSLRSIVLVIYATRFFCPLILCKCKHLPLKY